MKMKDVFLEGAFHSTLSTFTLGFVISYVCTYVYLVGSPIPVQVPVLGTGISEKRGGVLGTGTAVPIPVLKIVEKSLLDATYVSKCSLAVSYEK